ncbi:hypothetical protein RHSIM_Rhsim04G0010900 [Rhododendron simsii]|uniref:Coiled-coil domain-containing protein 22 homolog n=1 Tax=Rhododendron simsii TaxID=118357 RepID=A0A834HAP3_RHOSS|nr:hypothetical protein RHSIM_Rhsim04G0010900 [Rhododendron simsii]
MEESQEILLKSLANSGVAIPPGVSSIRDLTPATLFSICAQSLRLVDDATSLPASLPDSMADRLKICTDLAAAVSDLGFIGDLSFRKFLYPSEEDLYKLVRFLVKRLSELPEEHGEAADKMNITTSTITKENDFKDSSSKEWTENANVHRADLNFDGARTKLEDLRLNTEMPESSSTRSADASISGSHKTSLIQQRIGHNEEDMRSLQDQNESMERLVNSAIEASGNEESGGPMDDKLVLEFKQKLIDPRNQSSEMRHKIGKLRTQEKVLMEETSSKALEAQHLEEEHESLKSAAQMAFDDQHTTESYIAQLNDRVDAIRDHLIELERQRDILIKPLEEKRRSLEEALSATKPEAAGKLKKLKEIELEIEAVLSETKKREEEHSKLSADLDNQPKLASRRSYIQRITEITKNSRKQDADIERILKETRELQLESNSIQERLHRTYAVVDETVFREAKKDMVGRQAYRLLTSIHESFEQISDKILSTDRLRREADEHKAKLSALARRSFNVDKLKADLDAIRRENEFLEQRLHNS